MSKVIRIVILGAPASGKGTISERMAKKFNLKHISSGDHLRLQMKNKTPLGLEAKTFIERGQLVPDVFMTKFMLEELRVLGETSWLLDGFPRTHPQAQKLWAQQSLNLAVNLDVPFDVIIERVKGRYIHIPSGRVYNTGFNAPKVPGKDDITGEVLVQREDDKPETVQKRLGVYKEMTQPVIDFYKSQGILQTFHGHTTNEIWPKIEDYLTKKFGK